MAKELLVDTYVFNPSKTKLYEAVDKKGGVIIEGEFGFVDKKNGNNRIYPARIMEREINSFNKRFGKKGVNGLLDHPENGRTTLSKVSHVIEKAWLKDGMIYGRARCLNTSKGKDLKALYEGGAPVGVSSRGYGSVVKDDNGADVVQDDFELKTWDFVEDPSAGVYPELKIEGKEENDKENIVEVKDEPPRETTEEIVDDEDEENKDSDSKKNNVKDDEKEGDEKEKIDKAQSDNASEIAKDIDKDNESFASKDKKKQSDDKNEENKENKENKENGKKTTQESVDPNSVKQEVSGLIKELKESAIALDNKVFENREKIAIDKIKNIMIDLVTEDSVSEIIKKLQEENVSLQESNRVLKDKNHEIESKNKRLVESLDTSMRKLIFEKGLTVVGVHNLEKFEELVGDDRHSKSIKSLKESVEKAVIVLSEDDSILLQNDLIDSLNTFVETDRVLQEEIESIKKEKNILLEEKTKKERCNLIYNECDAKGLLEGYENKSELKVLFENCEDVNQASEIISTHGVAMKTDDKYTGNNSGTLAERLRLFTGVNKKHLTEQFKDEQFKEPSNEVVNGVNVKEFNDLI